MLVIIGDATDMVLTNMTAFVYESIRDGRDMSIRGYFVTVSVICNYTKKKLSLPLLQFFSFPF